MSGELMGTLGKALVAVGGMLAVIGGGMWLMARWLPRGMPGDLVVRRPGWALYVPIVTMIVLSLALTIVVNVILRLFRR